VPSPSQAREFVPQMPVGQRIWLGEGGRGQGKSANQITAHTDNNLPHAIAFTASCQVPSLLPDSHATDTLSAFAKAADSLDRFCYRILHSFKARLFGRFEVDLFKGGDSASTKPFLPAVSRLQKSGDGASRTVLKPAKCLGCRFRNPKVLIIQALNQGRHDYIGIFAEKAQRDCRVGSNKGIRIVKSFHQPWHGNPGRAPQVQLCLRSKIGIQQPLNTHLPENFRCLYANRCGIVC
jgi:hypothetical protein